MTTLAVLATTALVFAAPAVAAPAEPAPDVSSPTPDEENPPDTQPPDTVPAENVVGDASKETDASGADDIGTDLNDDTFNVGDDGRSTSTELLLGSTASDLESAQDDLRLRLEEIRAAESALVDAEQALVDAAAKKSALEATALSYSEREQAAVVALVEARQDLVERAAAAYVAGPSVAFDSFINDDINQSSARVPYLELVTGLDVALVDRLGDARDEAGGRAAGLADQIIEAADNVTSSSADVVAARDSISAAQRAADTAASTVDTLSLRLSVLEGRPDRLIYPVAGQSWFVDTWGAPRSGGRKHEGIDIIANEGTPLVAVEAGTVIKVGYVSLGGWRIWIEGDSGTAYYYAHLYDYAPGIAEGQRVELGTQIGWVGRTGNARFSVPHLHFEIHPGGRGTPPINPYPLMYSLAGESKTTGGDVVGREPVQFTFG